MLQFLLVITLAGIVGTCFGGVLALFCDKRKEEHIGMFLSFASGIMLAIIAFDLLPEALEMDNWMTVLVGVSLGVLAIWVLEHFVSHNHDIEALPKEGLIKAGIVMMVSVALHNIPSGIVIGAGYHADFHFGIALASVIALHNIPEGMSLMVPLLAGGMRRQRALFLVSITGIPTLIGGLLGYMLHDIPTIFIAFSLAFASGAMLYASWKEIIPQARRMCMKAAFYPSLLMGIIIGITFIHFTHGA